jgi:glycosyl transferase family 2
VSEETSSGFNPRTEPPFTAPGEAGLTTSTEVLPGTSTSSAPTRRKGQRRHRPKVSIPGVLVVAGIIGSGVLVTEWPPARWLVYAAWMMPMLELALLVVGQAWFRWRFRMAPEGKFRHAIIQVTTKGAEYDRVSEIIAQIRSYRLSADYQIWVVLEPGHRTDYPQADRVLVVPDGFAARSAHKARALEYSRQVRQSLGYDRSDVKVIFNDDDVTLTKAYIERAFAADYDICEGVVTPRTAYGLRPWSHFLTSHADDIRTHACLVYCSVFQGIFRRPLHVHGEGMVVTGRAEAVVTWDWPVIASEDLVFGHKAAQAGLSWGWFHEYAEVTSPWSVRDFITQRERWLWGDIHAMRHREALPPLGSLMVAAKYVAGVLALLCSASGLYLRFSGAIPATSQVFEYAKVSIVAWVAVFFACGWIGASAAHARGSDDSRLLSAVLAVVMVPVSLLLAFAAIAVPLVQGDPRSFKTIRKTKGAQ